MTEKTRKLPDCPFCGGTDITIHRPSSHGLTLTVLPVMDVARGLRGLMKPRQLPRGAAERHNVRRSRGWMKQKAS